MLCSQHVEAVRQGGGGRGVVGRRRAVRARRARQRPLRVAGGTGRRAARPPPTLRLPAEPRTAAQVSQAALRTPRAAVEMAAPARPQHAPL